jgi:monolysocardiolipin acyltransferase
VTIVLCVSRFEVGQGFDKLMPEGRTFPWKYIPRVGVKLSVTFGDPLSPQVIQAALRGLAQEGRHHTSSSGAQHHHPVSTVVENDDAIDGQNTLFGINGVERVREGVAREAISADLEQESRKRKIDHTRSMITAIVQGGVEAVGRKVSGNRLGKKADV